MRLSNDEDIISFCDEKRKYVSMQNLDFINIEIDFISNPTLLILEGFLPNFDLIESNEWEYYGVTPTTKKEILILAFEAFIEKNSEKEFIFWFGKKFEDILNLKIYKYWKYGTIKYWKDLAEKNAYSLPLLLFDSSLCYSSKRPKTEMIQFKNPSLLKNNIKINRTIPVSRYGSGMSRGLYFKNKIDSKQFCGTFYYQEPESKVFLNYNTFLKANNKLSAFKILNEKLSNEKSLNYNLSLLNPESFNNFQIVNYLQNYLPLPVDLMMTPLELCDYVEFLAQNGIKIGELARFLNFDENQNIGEKKYVGKFLGFYAAEDELDQIICILGKKLNYDIIILEKMVGSHQIVTEILDTRERTESFDNLIFS